MYYDRFGRTSSTQQPTRQPTRQLAPQPPAPRPQPALPPLPPSRPLATQAPTPLLKSYLDVHRTVWHVDSLKALYPEILTYLESRYDAAHLAGGLYVRSVDGAYPDVAFDHSDLRVVAEYLLSREYRQALFDEHIAPAIDRLSA